MDSLPVSRKRKIRVPRRVLKKSGDTALVAFATMVLEDADLQHAVNGMLYGTAIRTLNQHMKEILKMPDLVAKLNNHRLKPEGLSYGLEVRIRVACTTRPMVAPS